MTTRRPPYDQLPVRVGDPAGSAWGLRDTDDEVGTLGDVGANHVVEAASLVRAGTVFSLNWELTMPGPAILGRFSPVHRLLAQTNGFDDAYDDFHPQASSQWDALCHVSHPKHGFYNGRDAADVDGTRGRRLGVDVWAKRGIAGRFTLVDLAAFFEARGDPIDCATSRTVDVTDLDRALASQEVQVAEGDILLLRFGWISWYEALSAAERESLARKEVFPAPGMEPSQNVARWLWDHGVSAVVADCPAVEAMPFDQSTEEGFLHYRLIPLLGLAMGELFDLDDLANDCLADGRWNGLFTAAPLNMPGGAGSPANALAIK